MSGETELVVSRDQHCKRCSGVALLGARVPHGWINRSGVEVDGWRDLVLCPVCDAEDPAAADLLALFAVDGTVTDGNLETFTELASAWAETVAARTVDPEALAEEEAAWRQGEL